MPALLGGDVQDLFDRINPQSATGPGLQGQFVEDGGRGEGFGREKLDHWLARGHVKGLDAVNGLQRR